MYKYYRVGLTLFRQIYDRYLSGRVFYKEDGTGYIVKTSNKAIQEFLSKNANEIEYDEK